MNRFVRSLAIFTFVLISTQTAFAATFTVTKTADTNDGACDADCSFREAVIAAVASVDDDTIEFDPGVFSAAQTITLSGTEIVITGSGTLTIDGPGADLLTISGNNASRIITNGDKAVTTISGITFTDGNGAGEANSGRAGAVYNNGGNLTLNDVVVTGNSGSNGGGLSNASAATMTINNSVISDNSATGSGGALQNFSTSTLFINNTTVSGNVSNGATGGGGGQYNGTVRITNSTYTGNSAPSGSGGGLQSNGSSMIITNSTFVGNSSLNNGGGIHRGTTNVNFFIRNSIVAGNSGTAASPDITNSINGLNSEGNNIIGNVGTSTGWVASDLLNTDPMLAPLADNGGLGMTFLPLAGSPAIDGGQNCVVDLTCATNNPPFALTTDQRGVARPSGPAVDIGSVEVASAPAAASVSGRVAAPGGRSAGRVMVTISDTNGVIQTAYTNQFGNFSFEDIPTGETYTLNVVSKQYVFTPEDVTVSGNVGGVVITANSENVK